MSLGYPKQQERNQSYQGGDKNKIGSLATATDLASTSVQNAPCKKPQSETESDLCEQWRAANAAEKSAQWTVFGVLASIVGISLLLWQIMLTREAVQDTGDATKAMQDANNIANETSVRQLRPYLHITNASFKLHTPILQILDSLDEVNTRPDAAVFSVYFKNHGQTPALSVEMWIKCSIEKDRNGSKSFADDSETVWANMPPNMEHNQPVLVKDIGDFYDRIVEGIYMVLLDGRLEYKDFFGNSYRTDFRYYSTKTHFTGNTYQIAWHGNEAT